MTEPFGRGNAYASISNSGYVSVTDLDGDGNLDIYSGVGNGGYYGGDDSSPATSYALMGYGDGTFAGAPSAAGSNTGANIGDVNGDGYPDMIVPTSSTSGGKTAVFSVLLGSATGQFKLASTITAPATVTFTVSEFVSPVTQSTSNLTPASYVVGDLNGDGKADVAYVSNYGGYAVYFVALRNGDGTSATATATGFPQLAPAAGFDISTTIGSLRVGDFNHDGKADLIFNYNDTSNPGTFAATVYLQGLGVLPGSGTGSFGAPILSNTYNSSAAPGNGGIPMVSFIADFNRDGSFDVLASNGTFAVVGGIGVTTSTIQIYLGKPDGSFGAPTTALTTTSLGQMTVADLNNNGRLDVAAITETAAGQAQLSVVIGNGDGTFATPAISKLPGGDAIRSAGLASADFDSDGKVDLVLLDSKDFSGIFYGKGDGTFTSIPSNGNIIPKDLISLSANGQETVLDVNKDGKPDIVAGSTVLINTYGATVVVTKSTTTTALTASTPTIAFGSIVTLTATITGAAGGSGTPSGTVTFSDGGTVLGTATLASGVATLSTSTLAIGSHSVVATYAGDAAFSRSPSSAVNVSVTTPTVATTTTLSASPPTGATGTSVTLTATVSAASGTAIPSGTVTFRDGTASLGTAALDVTGKATFNITTLTAGSHSITAAYAGATGFVASTSVASTVVIIAPVPDFTLGIAPPSGSETQSAPAIAIVSVLPVNGFNGGGELFLLRPTVECRVLFQPIDGHSSRRSGFNYCDVRHDQNCGTRLQTSAKPPA